MDAQFTPLAATIGGLLIGIASAALLAMNGRIAGISGIIDGVVVRRSGEGAWRHLFLLGLLLGAGAGMLLTGVDVQALQLERSPGLIVASGLLVGFGTKMANGCTSGHGVCGNARMSPRSIVSTILFIGVGMLTVGLVGLS